MAIDVERERVAFPIQDDPMRTFDDPRNGNRPAFAGAINDTYARAVAARADRPPYHDGMNCHGPAHQPIAGWRAGVRTPTLRRDGPV